VGGVAAVYDANAKKLGARLRIPRGRAEIGRSVAAVWCYQSRLSTVRDKKLRSKSAGTGEQRCPCASPLAGPARLKAHTEIGLAARTGVRHRRSAGSQDARPRWVQLVYHCLRLVSQPDLQETGHTLPNGFVVADFFDDPITAMLVEQVLALPAGSQLPSEREQADQLGVSRTALRDRLRHLEAVGVLERRIGAGTFTRQIQPEMVSQSLALGLMASHMSLSSLKSVRVALERQAALEAANARDHVNIAKVHVAVDRMYATTDRDEMLAADVAFHRALFDASSSPALKFFADSLFRILRQSMVMLNTDDQFIAVRGVHRTIYDAVSAGDPILSMRAMDEHFALLDQLEVQNEALLAAKKPAPRRRRTS